MNKSSHAINFALISNFQIALRTLPFPQPLNLAFECTIGITYARKSHDMACLIVKLNIIFSDDMLYKYKAYSRQKFSRLSWMVKRYYIRYYFENFRGDTERTRTTASDLIRPSIESSLTRREKKTHIKHVVWVVREGGFLQVANLNKVRK